ncbi:hypothetical protein A2U01_0059554, partial [Trifolium medium]|nr:hypothetical protein [Trifolium medium]
LRNRKVDIAEKPKEDKKSKASEAGDNPTKETIEVEETAEKEPVTQKGSQPAPPPVYPKSQAIVAPYPPQYGKKEIIKEQNKKFEGYLTQMEINVPLKDMLQISPPINM